MGGILFSFAGEQSEYVDPVTFTIATISIFVAIVGLALIFKLPAKKDPANQRVNLLNQKDHPLQRNPRNLTGPRSATPAEAPQLKAVLH
jgi:hypothetical protein